jgi:hypothetical protein
MDIVDDNYPYKTSRSLQNLTTGAAVAVSGLIEVIESRYSLPLVIGRVAQ